MEKEIMHLVAEGMSKKLFPLYTIQTMAERWKVNRQLVIHWRKRHNNFPKAITGIAAPTKNKQILLYPLYEIERYEKEKGIEVND